MNIKRIGQSVLPLLLLIETPFNKIVYRKKHSVKTRSRNNILIVGGSFFNKGAQAMSFTVVDQIKRRFPKKNIYLLLDYDYKNVDDKNFTFNTLPWTYELRFKLLNPINKYLYSFYKTYLKEESKLHKVLKNSLMIIDISGYSFSSEMGQNWTASILDIMIAEKYNIDYYIFPQSIGPFNFSLFNRFCFKTLTKSFLNYPKSIYVRENDGLKFMRQITNKNITKSYDIVLTNKKYNINNIFLTPEELKEVEIKPDSVALIPNNKISDRINEDEFFELYSTIINTLIKEGKNVYILRHSAEDFLISKQIKELFIDNSKVIFLNEDFNVFELETILSQFDFMVASRYHSIVNSYRQGIPAVVISWAYKYKELMESFDQFEYYFDIKQKVDSTELKNKLETMIKDFPVEKQKIITNLEEILQNSESCFNSLTLSKDKTVIKTRNLDLCLSCEACEAACPVNAISMKFERGQFLPDVNLEKCTNCGICLSICPGIDLNPLKIRKAESYQEYDKKSVISTYNGFSKDENFRERATSGGIISNLISELLEKKEYDGAFTLNFKKFEGKPVRLELIKDPHAVFDSTGSKYLPASIFEILKMLKKNPKERYIIVGTPCQFHSINKFITRYKLNIRDNLLFLGLFCDATLNFNFLSYTRRLYENKRKTIDKFYYRSKDKHGWPGHSKISYSTGETFLLRRNFRIFCKRYFQLNRCSFCYDKLNSLADISCGDCYIKGKSDKKGVSNIIIRTEIGYRVFNNNSELFVIENEDFGVLQKSQNISAKSLRLEYNKSLYGLKRRLSLKEFYKLRLGMLISSYFINIGQKRRYQIIFHFYILKIFKLITSRLRNSN